MRLIRDGVGMAHLYADREEDGFYGLGYATGEDRLRQVLMWYVAVRGELAAKFGPKTPSLSADPAASALASTRSPLADAVASDTKTLKYQFLSIARRNFHALPAAVSARSAILHSRAERIHARPPRAYPGLGAST